MILHSTDEALSLFVTAKLTKSQYIKIRTESKARNANIYPSYHHVKGAKERCFPPKDSINIDESLVDVQLETILNHTCLRILETQAPVLENISASNEQDLFLDFKRAVMAVPGTVSISKELQQG